MTEHPNAPIFVNLHISCNDLKNADVGSKSDPFAVVYMRKSINDGWVEVGRTEVVENNLNPSFVTPIKVQYCFEAQQFMRFVIYDSDDKSQNTDKSDQLGATETTMASIMRTPDGSFVQELQYLMNTKVKAGRITVVAKEVRACECNYQVNFCICGRHLDKKDMIGKSDPYLIIKQKIGAGVVNVHQTETIMNTLNPDWNAFSINLEKLCGCDMNLPLIFDCYDWDKRSEHDQIGAVEVTVNQLMQLATQGPVELPLINAKKAGKRGYQNSGTLYFKMLNIGPVPTFVNYIRGGCEMNMVVAIDFTASNGVPGNEHSLHHISDAEHPNQYEMAIQSVGTILSYYDRDGMIPVYGYGANVNGTVSHCFPLNGNPSNPEVAGVPGILDVYHRTIENVRLSGPTYFHEVIHQTADIIRFQQKAGGQKYYVLLIITDGAINDMEKTTEEIIAAANSLPLSIVIVGVGYSPELKKMEKLDGDDSILVDKNGKKAVRDIVQYVPMTKYIDCPQKLAEETLAEIPHQLVSYMSLLNILPLNPVPMPMAPAGAPPAK